MKLSIPGAALAVASFFFALSVAVAQETAPQPPQWSWPEHMKNAKVLPRDTKPEQLEATMKGFTRSLGVRCTYCHVGEEGQPLSTYDFVSDKNDHKDTARGMLRLVAHLNTDHLPAITGLPDARVTCFTCHRGESKPATEPPPRSPAPAPASVATPAPAPQPKPGGGA